jgi:hypothetical protein
MRFLLRKLVALNRRRTASAPPIGNVPVLPSPASLTSVAGRDHRSNQTETVSSSATRLGFEGVPGSCR